MAGLTLLKENIEGEKSAFIATFSTFLLWLLTLLLSSALGGTFLKHRAVDRTAATHQGNASSTTTTPQVKSKFDLERAARLIFLGLFSSVAVNHMLYGVTRTIAVLSWIAFAITVVYLVVRTALHRRSVGSPGLLHRLVDLAALGSLAVIFTAMWSVAFHVRW
jgi:hypothetical protein